VAIINGVDQENVKSISGIETEVKLPSLEVVKPSRPAVMAVLYDGISYTTLKEDGAVSVVSNGWIYPVYLRRPVKVSNADVKTGEVTTSDGRKFEFFWVADEVSFGSSTNSRGYNDFEKFKVEKVEEAVGYAVPFDPSVDQLSSGGNDVTKSTPVGYFYPAYTEAADGLTQLYLASQSLGGEFNLWVNLGSVTTGARDSGGYPVFRG